ncbi:MAG: Trp biosynthesis-associated membrane protein [Angustibacter sp.]
MTGRPSRAVPIVLALVGAGVVLLSAGRSWVQARAQAPVVGVVDVAVTGRQAAPMVSAMALVAVAGVLVLWLASPSAPRFTGVLLVAAGVLGLGAAVDVLRDPVAAVQADLAAASGTTAVQDVQTSTSWWLGPATLGMALVVLSGVVTICGVGAGRRGGDRAALAHLRGAAGRNARSAGSPRADRGARGTTDPGPPDPAATWEALSRGDDPTR